MGTRIEDQPPEHWAGPESLDPTPVWKQFALIGIFLFLGLVLLGGVAVFAAAPQLVSPPALVPGDRLVLSIADLLPVGGAPKRRDVQHRHLRRAIGWPLRANEHRLHGQIVDPARELSAPRERV